MAKGTGRIPRYLDAPITILIWDADIFLPAAVLVVLGIFTRTFFMCACIAFTYLYLMARCQTSLPRGMIANILHWTALYPYSGYPDGAIKSFRE